MKTYTCKTCLLSFLGKASYDEHIAGAEHALRREERVAEEEAAKAWAHSRLTAVHTKNRLGGEDRMLAVLAWENYELASVLSQLEAEAQRAAERLQRDIVRPVAERGAAAIYSGSHFQNLQEIPALEGQAYGRAQVLRSVAHAAGARCEATYAPREWKFYERLADITAVEGDAADPGWRLESAAFGVLGGRFATEAAAIKVAVDRVRETLQAEEVRR